MFLYLAYLLDLFEIDSSISYMPYYLYFFLLLSLNNQVKQYLNVYKKINMSYLEHKEIKINSHCNLWTNQ